MGGAGGKLCDALRRFDGKTIAKHAQFTVVLLEQGKDLPCSLRRHQTVQQAGGLTGVALGGIGVAAVYSTHGVVTQIPHGRTVGGDGIPDAGQLCHHGRQAGQRTARGRHHGHAVRHSAGDGFAGGSGDFVVPAQQSAVQIQRNKANRGKALQHKGSFYNQYNFHGKKLFVYFIAPQGFAQDGGMWYNHTSTH